MCVICAQPYFGWHKTVHLSVIRTAVDDSFVSLKKTIKKTPSLNFLKRRRKLTRYHSYSYKVCTHHRYGLIKNLISSCCNGQAPALPTAKLRFSMLLRGEFKSGPQLLHTNQQFSEYIHDSTIPRHCIYKT